MEDTADHFFALAAGTRLDEYEIVSIIGQGSFGITYLAEDVNLGTRLAIKEYLPGDWAVRDSTKSVRPKSTNSKQSFEWGMDAFLKEARILAGISHPNIVKVRRFFRASGTAYIVMDFVEGRAFGDLLAKDYPSGGYPAKSLKALLLALLDGLGSVHEAGIIHRDIKPGNILIQADGTPILIDFGAARNFQKTIAGGMTVIVTPGYAPIEQYAEDDDQGPFTDIYSLGAVAYRAIAGRAPLEPYKRLRGGAFTSAVAVGGDRYPTALLSAIDWAISIHAKDRPQSALQFIAQLRGDDDDKNKIAPIIAQRPTASPAAKREPVSRSHVLTQTVRELGDTRRAYLVAAALLAIGLGASAVAYYRSGSPPATETVTQKAATRTSEPPRPDVASTTQVEPGPRAAETAQPEPERPAAASAKDEANRRVAEASRQDADRQTALATQLEANRKAELAKQESARRVAELAKEEAARKTAEVARQEADRRAAEIARLEANRKAASLDGRWFADLPRNNCGAVRVQAIVMGDVIFGNLGMPAGNRAFRAVIGSDGTFTSAGFFDKISGRFNGNTVELAAGNQCSTWAGTARREPFILGKASKEEITAAFAGKAAIFANGESIYSPDGTYTLTDRNGVSKGKYVISDGAICVTFVSGIVQCNAILKDGASFTAVSTQGYAYPVAFK